MTRFATLVCVAALALSACGSSSDESSDPTTTVAGASTGTDEGAPEDTLAPNPDKPEVAIPDTLPTELVVTELRACRRGPGGRSR